MPSALRHRAIMIIAIVVGGLVWASAADVLRAADGSAGVSLMASTLNPAVALLMTTVAGLPALILAAAAAASRRVTSGLLAFCVCLCVLAITGGPIDGWMRRATLPGGYADLILEMIIWQVVIIAAVIALGRSAQALRKQFPSLADDDPQHGPDLMLTLKRPDTASVVACFISACIGGGLTWFMLRSTASGQVVGTLIVSFGVGALVAQMAVPKANPAAALFSPAIVAIAAYAMVLWQFETADQVLAAWYQQAQSASTLLPAPALALPIYYASAGVAGSCLGIGFGRSVTDEEDTPPSAWSAIFHLVRGDDRDRSDKSS